MKTKAIKINVEDNSIRLNHIVSICHTRGVTYFYLNDPIENLIILIDKTDMLSFIKDAQLYQQFTDNDIKRLIEVLEMESEEVDLTISMEYVPNSPIKLF